MNFLGGGERHSSADYRRASSRSADPHTASPGLLSVLPLGRPGDVRNFIHRRIIGGISGAIGGILTGNPLAALAGGIRGFTGGGSVAAAVPQATQCPPGFVNTGAGCVARFTPTSAQPSQLGPGRAFVGARGVPGLADGRAGAFVQPTPVQERFREGLGLAGDPAAGVAVMGRFGAGFEPEVIMTDTRRCGRGAVLGVDGLCYNRRDLRNSDRFWPRGRRPLLTGGEVRAISVASSAAKKLERKQKQLMELGLLKRPTRSRRAAPAGHRATLTHDGGSQH